MDNIKYVAGFFDGEGSIYICRGKKDWGTQYTLEISFTNTNKESLDFIKNEFNCGNLNKNHEGNEKRKTLYVLRFSSKQAKMVLEKMLPHLIIKKEKAKIAIEFQSKLHIGNKKSIPLEEMEKYKMRIQNA